jgi:hypothetical protein
MKEIVLKDFAIKLDLEEAKKHLRIKDKNKRVGRLAEILSHAETIAKPGAVYKEAFVDEIVNDAVTINGIRFKSKVMASNFEKVGRVFPFAATCGTEIEEWSNSFNGILEKFWSDNIKKYVLYKTIEALTIHIMNTYETGRLAFMNPGSLPDWPLSEQGPLISILGDIQSLIGVTLTANMMLIPLKSATGIFFPTETGYENCQLCRKKDCPNRRAPFDLVLYKQKLG